MTLKPCREPLCLPLHEDIIETMQAAMNDPRRISKHAQLYMARHPDPQALLFAIQHWTEEVRHFLDLPADRGFGFQAAHQDTATGETLSGQDMYPPLLWSLRLIIARLNDDEPQFVALVDSVGGNVELFCEGFVYALNTCCGMLGGAVDMSVHLVHVD